MSRQVWPSPQSAGQLSELTQPATDLGLTSEPVSESSDSKCPPFVLTAAHQLAFLSLGSFLCTKPEYKAGSEKRFGF